MKANITMIQKRRKYSEEFKRALVSDFESGNFSVNQLKKLHNVNKSSIYNWIYKYSTFNEKGIRVVEMTESSHKKVKDLEQKVKTLEQIIGQKQIAIDYLEKMIELAQKEFDIDIKKNSNTSPSGGSKHTKK